LPSTDSETSLIGWKALDILSEQISTADKDRANATADSILGGRLMMKTGGGYRDIEEEGKRHKDVYISKLDTLIKTELSMIR